MGRLPAKILPKNHLPVESLYRTLDARYFVFLRHLVLLDLRESRRRSLIWRLQLQWNE
jgi:hypothetical protein